MTGYEINTTHGIQNEIQGQIQGTRELEYHYLEDTLLVQSQWRQGRC